MGHYYRERHSEQPASTTSDDIEGLTGDNTLAELRDQAAALGLPTYGTKAELAQRIADAESAPEE